AMARWLGLVLAFGLVANRTGAHVANGAHVGGAIAGAAIAATWQRGYRHSGRSTAAVLALCTAVVVGCIAIVAVRDRIDPFAAMGLQERSDFTNEAVVEGRCREAYDGLLAVERLRAKLAPVTPLRNRVQAACGPAP
ncbi:MAG TPA: hypothetical protein VN894_21580, partial [Polyangiaceae bacterium]|nr:hypothetical protein [Polyangiaceae bacterium]